MDPHNKTTKIYHVPFRRDRAIMVRRICVILSLFSSHSTVVVQCLEFKYLNKYFQFFSTFSAFLVRSV